MRKLYVIDKDGNRRTVSLTWIYVFLSLSFIIDVGMVAYFFLGG